MNGVQDWLVRSQGLVADDFAEILDQRSTVANLLEQRFLVGGSTSRLLLTSVQLTTGRGLLGMTCSVFLRGELTGVSELGAPRGTIAAGVVYLDGTPITRDVPHAEMAASGAVQNPNWVFKEVSPERAFPVEAGRHSIEFFLKWDFGTTYTNPAYVYSRGARLRVAAYPF